MSDQALKAAWAEIERNDGLSPSTRLVLLAIAHAHVDGAHVSPSRELLADFTGLTTRTVHDALAELTTRKVISKTVRQHENGSRVPDRLVLHFLQEADEMASRAKYSKFSGQDENASGLAGERVPPIDSEKKSGRKPREATNALDAATRVIWEATPDGPRQRCGKNDPGKLRFALRDAVDRGDDLEAIVSGICVFYAEHPDGGPAPNTLVDLGTWKGKADAKPVVAPEGLERWDGAIFGRPDWAGGPYGTDADPGPARQWQWLDAWFGFDADEREAFWTPKHGPGPGELNSRIWQTLLDAYLRVNPKARLIWEGGATE